MSEAPLIANGPYKIQNTDTKKYLEVSRDSDSGDVSVVGAESNDDIGQSLTAVPEKLEQWYFYATELLEGGFKYDIMSAALFDTSLAPRTVADRSDIIGSKTSIGWVVSKTDDTFQLMVCGNKDFAMTYVEKKQAPGLSKLSVNSKVKNLKWNITSASTPKPNPGSITSGDYYRIRNFTLNLCLTANSAGGPDDGAVYVAEQQDTDDTQKWKLLRNGQGLFLIQNSVSGYFMGYFDYNATKYSSLVAKKDIQTQWYLKNMFGSAYTIADKAMNHAVGFPEYLADVGYKAILMNNVDAPSQIWFFEPWDNLRSSELVQPLNVPADAPIKDGVYKIRNVGTKNFIIIDLNTTYEAARIQKRATEPDTGYQASRWDVVSAHATIARIKAYPYTQILSLRQGQLVVNSDVRTFRSADIKGQKGYYITVPGTKPLQCIVDDPKATDDKLYAADLNSSDSSGNQRWEFLEQSVQ